MADPDHDYNDTCKCTQCKIDRYHARAAEPVISNETRAVITRMACDFLNGKFHGPSELMRLESALTCAYLRGQTEANDLRSHQKRTRP